jgi:superfamily I DNA/RNA helicase
MKERLTRIMPSDFSRARHLARLTVSTLHALGLSCLRQQGEKIGLPPDFQILAESRAGADGKEILSQSVPQEPPAGFKMGAENFRTQEFFRAKWPERAIFSRIMLRRYFLPTRRKLLERNMVDF